MSKDGVVSIECRTSCCVRSDCLSNVVLCECCLTNRVCRYHSPEGHYARIGERVNALIQAAAPEIKELSRDEVILKVLRFSQLYSR